MFSLSYDSTTSYPTIDFATFQPSQTSGQCSLLTGSQLSETDAYCVGVVSVVLLGGDGQGGRPAGVDHHRTEGDLDGDIAPVASEQETNT